MKTKAYVSDEEIEWIEKQRKSNNKRKQYRNQYNGSYEASRGDYEGACLARAEYDAGQIS